MKNRPNFSETSELSLNSLKTTVEADIKQSKPISPIPTPTQPIIRANKKKCGRKPLGNLKKQQISINLSPHTISELQGVLNNSNLSLGICISEYIETHIKNIKKYYENNK